MQNLILNNGKTAEYLYTDFWSRPVYKITTDKGNEVEVCCTELNGTFLHTMTSDGEPIGALKEE